MSGDITLTSTIGERPREHHVGLDLAALEPLALSECRELGARFAKWRAVITTRDRRPTRGCIAINAHALARYAGLCQEAGIVPDTSTPARAQTAFLHRARCKSAGRMDAYAESMEPAQLVA